jgi:hypothetical protein
MRPIFSDKYNSWVHFLCGMLTYWSVWIGIIFVLYQLTESAYLRWGRHTRTNNADPNLGIDLLEFGLGVCAMHVLSLVFT